MHESVSLMSAGRAFQACGPATEKASAPAGTKQISAVEFIYCSATVLPATP